MNTVLPFNALSSGITPALEHECLNLRLRGIDPINAANLARALNCEQLMRLAFPRMPFSTRDDLLTGKAALVLDPEGHYAIVRRDTP